MHLQTNQHTKNISKSAVGWLPWMITIVLAIVVLMMHVRLYHYAFDDAYIHFRIARNFVETGSPYFNPGEIVKVSTSTGWTVFLTLLYAVAHLVKIENSFPLIISIINALISVAGMLIYTEILETLLKDRLPLWSTLLFQFSYLALLLPASIGLMEIPFALLIAGVGIYFLHRSKPSGFVLLGLAAHIRLELVVLLSALGIIMFLAKQFRLQHILGYIAIGVLPLLGYDLYFYQTIIPHSIISKSIIYDTPWYYPALQILFQSLPDQGVNFKPIFLGLGAITFSAVVITLLTAFLEWKESKSSWPILFCLWGVLVISGYLFSKALIFDWYIPLYTIPLLIACFMLSARIVYPRHLFIRGFVYIVFLLSAVSLTRTTFASIQNPSTFTLFESGSRVKMYLSIGKILYEDYPNSTLLTSEIGGLGYAFKGKIMDAAGLASPEALAFHPMNVPDQRSSGTLGAIPPDYVKISNPDLIVSYDNFAQALLKDAIVRKYNVIQIPAYLPEDAVYSHSQEIWGSNYLRVFVRKDLPLSEKFSAMGQ